jgi:hypothetical protein
MVQALPVRDAAEDAAKDRAGWAGRLLQARAEIAYARTAAQQFLMLPDSSAIREIVQSAERK